MPLPFATCIRNAVVLCAWLVGFGAHCGAEPVNGEPEMLKELRVVAERDAGAARFGVGSAQWLPGGPPGEANGATLAQALSGIPGLVLQEGFGGFDPPRLTVRGSGLQSAPVNRGLWFRLDGVPLNAADGSLNTALVEPALISAVEFRPGPNDPMAAAVALGGALDFESTRNDGRGAGFAAYGSHGLWRGGVRASGVASVAVAGTRSEGWRPQSAQQRFAGLACLDHAFAQCNGGSVRVFAGVYAANPRYDVPGPLPLAAATATPATVSAMVAADRPRRETEFARAVVGASAERPDRTLEVKASLQHTDDWFRQLRANGIGKTVGPDAVLQVAGLQRWEDFAVRANLSWQTGSRRSERAANLAGVAGAAFADLRLTARNSVGRLEGSWSPAGSQVAVSAGTAWSSLERGATGSPLAAVGRLRTDALLPFAGVDWLARTDRGARLGFFARLAQAAEAPTFDDLIAVRGAAPALTVAWVPLRLQKADSLEGGVWGEAGQGRLFYRVTAYTARWHNELLRLADANGAARGTVNAGRTVHRGVESLCRWRVLRGAPGLDFVLAHTWNQAHFERDPTNGPHRLAGLPPHAGAAQLVWAQKRGVFAALGADWVWGRTYADHSNRLFYDGHTLASARLGWQARHWTFAVAVSNLFDRVYIASTSGVIDLARTPATTALFLPGGPRAVLGSVEWRW